MPRSIIAFAFLRHSPAILPAAGAAENNKIAMIDPQSGSFALQGHEAAPKSHRVQCLN